jgi:hypothetical protein
MIFLVKGCHYHLPFRAEESSGGPSLQQYKSRGSVFEWLVPSLDQLLIVQLVIESGVRGRAMPPHDLRRGTLGVRDDILTRIHATAWLAVAGPETPVEYLGHYAAVGVPPNL